MSAAMTRRRGRGRPPCCPRELAVRIVLLRSQGLSLTHIAKMLNDDHVPTPMGGPHWRKSHVDRVLHTRYAQDIRDQLL